MFLTIYYVKKLRNFKKRILEKMNYKSISDGIFLYLIFYNFNLKFLLISTFNLIFRV